MGVEWRSALTDFYFKITKITKVKTLFLAVVWEGHIPRFFFGYLCLIVEIALQLLSTFYTISHAFFGLQD